MVILKSSDQPLRLPTYHFAHAVDDHLMRVTLVIRGEEWLSSVPLHHQLFDALGFPRIPYAHVAPLMKQDGGSRRKLSKRRDPEASVGYYIEQGYPGRGGAVLPARPGQRAARRDAAARGAGRPRCGCPSSASPARCSTWSSWTTSAPTTSRTLPGAEILDRVLPWADGYDTDLASVLRAERDLALRALAVEREDADNPRKDLRKWAEFRPVYGFFFPEIFELVTDPADARFGGLDPDLVRAIGVGFRRRLQPPDPGPAWFDQIRDAGRQARLRAEQKDYKKNPDAYPGSIADASQVIRVLLTGSRRSPDLGQVCAAIGEPEVLRRARALS